MKSILRYPGSKWNLAKTIVSMIPEHKSYVEPFFGSGAVLFSKSKSPIETINDMDDEIVNLFRVIRENPDALKKAIYLTPYARTEYDNTFIEQTEDPVEKARLFLVKSLQSQGFRLTDKCGWKNDVQGREQSYCIKHFNEVPQIIDEVTRRLKEVQIENRDALELIQKFNYSNVFMYIDPPYILSTRTRKQYKHEMSDNDHERLLQILKNSKAKIMISGYQNEMYEEYLKGWKNITVNATAVQGIKRKEQLWYNYESNQITLEQFI